MSSDDEHEETPAERKWRTWATFTQQDPKYSGASDEDEVHFGQVRPVELEDTIDEQEENLDQEAEMAQAADIGVLLAQLTQANLALNQCEVDRDARVVVAAATRAREDGIKASVAKIDKCQGDNKPKLRRWQRNITTLHATQPGVTVAVAERTARYNLADTIEAFLADVANQPRAGIAWPALRLNVENILLGDQYDEVLRSEHRVMVQKAHENTGEYSERYLASAKGAYPEPWDRVTNQALIALFAEGLVDRRMAQDVGDHKSGPPRSPRGRRCRRRAGSRGSQQE